VSAERERLSVRTKRPEHTSSIMQTATWPAIRILRVVHQCGRPV
jgi:hypothetical protein